MMTLERTITGSFRLFAFQFFFWALTLFGLIYFEQFSPFVFINQLQTNLSIFLTNQWISLFDINIDMKGALLTFDHDLKLKIVNECNGLAAFLLFLAAALSYPTTLKNKVLWSILAYFILLVSNSIRLDWIAYHSIENPEDFKFLHEVVGRYIIAMIPLVIFYIFSSKVAITQSDKSSSI